MAAHPHGERGWPQGHVSARPWRVLTFLGAILVRRGGHGVPRSGKSTHERKGPWPVIPGPRRRRGEVIQRQWSCQVNTYSLAASKQS